MILVVSHPGDDHATRVLAELDGRHPAALFDTAQYPARAALSHELSNRQADAVAVFDGIGELALADVGSVWWRRPQGFTLHDGLDPAVASFSYTECHEAVSGCLAALDAAWVNPPELDERAHHKPLQLETARRVGLRIPDTLITNDPARARAFIDSAGGQGVVFKTFMATEAHWRETRLIGPNDLQALDTVRYAPIIFQHFVPAVADLRVTIVGDDIFTTVVKSAPGAYAVDYRMDLAGAAYRAGQLPARVQAPLMALMKALGLVYGAADFRLTPDGDYVFLEVNPAGEWLFVEDRSGQPITRAVANLLARLDHREARDVRQHQSSRRDRTANRHRRPDGRSTRSVRRRHLEGGRTR